MRDAFGVYKFRNKNLVTSALLGTLTLSFSSQHEAQMQTIDSELLTRPWLPRPNFSCPTRRCAKLFGREASGLVTLSFGVSPSILPL